MNLYFTGHGEKYAVEQTLLTLFPQERPVYPDTPPGGDNELELSFSRGKTWCTARATYSGKSTADSQVAKNLATTSEPAPFTLMSNRFSCR